jgi:hypothetical protein
MTEQSISLTGCRRYRGSDGWVETAPLIDKWCCFYPAREAWMIKHCLLADFRQNAIETLPCPQ